MKKYLIKLSIGFILISVLTLLVWYYSEVEYLKVLIISSIVLICYNFLLLKKEKGNLNQYLGIIEERKLVRAKPTSTEIIREMEDIINRLKIKLKELED